MKKIIPLLFISLLIVFDSKDVFPQAEFNTNNLGVSVNTYGRVRIFTPSTTGTRQIDRLSILVAKAPEQVFDYQNDAENEEPTILVGSPALSDFEIYGAYNNSFSNNPPDILQRQYVYGWTNGSYILVKNSIKNRETSAFNAIFGLDIISQILGTYGMDTIEYVASNDVIDIHKGSIHVGIKFLSHNLSSLTSFEWFSGYYVDTNYYNWMTHGLIDPVYYGGVEGPVIIPALNSISISSGDSTNFWFALAVGSTQQEMLLNMQQAENRYNVIVPVELTSFSASVQKSNVLLTWETASEVNNFGFEIERKVNSGWVTIGFKDGYGTTSEKQSYSYIDNISEISASKVSYRLKQIDYNGTFAYSEEVELDIQPSQFILYQNYPNPFNPETSVSFSLPQNDLVTLKVYNLLGETVSVLINEQLEAGNYTIQFDAKELSSGIYLYELSAGDLKQTRKMIIMK